LYDINHQSVLTAIAGQASIAIQNARLFAQTQQQLANLTTIQRTTSGLTAASSLDGAVNALLPQVAAAVRADSASLYLIEGEHMTRVGSYPQVANEGGMIAVRLAHYPFVQEAIQSRQGVSVTIDDPNLPDQARQSFLEAGITVNATIPLNTRDGVIGTLAITSQQEGRRFDSDDMSLLQTLADQATIAFERVRLLEDAQHRARREQLLREITGRVRSSADVDTIMKTAVQEIGRAMGRETFIRLGE
jgi:GAF domain-containing protein